MHILQVIHGYPPEYNAGSENYTKTITKELIKRGHKVSVFSRLEDPFISEYKINIDETGENNIGRYTINMARTKDRFVSRAVDIFFEKLLLDLRPDIVHFEHLNHLSLSLPNIANKQGIPTIYTLHDFWLMCPRGQFLQMNLDGEPWKQCDGQDDSKCAKICYSRYYGGNYNQTADEKYWTDWVHRRMNAVRESVNDIDVFISPSKTVMDSFVDSFGQREKVVYLDYGFELKKLSERHRNPEDGSFVFGYIGTHIPAKGVKSLIEAFSKLRGKTILRIWGREKSDYTPILRRYANSKGSEIAGRIQWMGEFNGDKIVEEVFDNVDCIVVPSIWLENSPLVIHEAQQARVPVLTADTGGMAEYVKDSQNGFLFKFRDVNSLTHEMEEIMRNPEIASSVGKRGYYYSQTGNVPSVADHVDTLLSIYRNMISKYRNRSKS